MSIFVFVLSHRTARLLRTKGYCPSSYPVPEQSSLGRFRNVYTDSASTAMVVLVIKLASQVYRRSKYELITDGDQFSNALKQPLPLAIIPLLFFIFEIPVFTFQILPFNTQCRNSNLSLHMCLSLECVFGCNSYNPHLCGSDMWQETQTYTKPNKRCPIVGIAFARLAMGKRV